MHLKRNISIFLTTLLAGSAVMNCYAYADDNQQSIYSNDTSTDTVLSVDIGDVNLAVEGDIPSGVYLSAEVLDDVVDYTKIINENNEEGLILTVKKAYDITLLDENKQPYQPVDHNKSVEVTIKDKDLEHIDDKIIYRINDENSRNIDVDKMVIEEQSDDSVTFTTDHFTVYTVGEESFSTDDMTIVKSITYEGITWTLYDTGLLVAKGNGRDHIGKTISGLFEENDLNIADIKYVYLDCTLYSILQYNGNNYGFFSGCTNLQEFSTGPNFKCSDYGYYLSMFKNCKSLKSADMSRFAEGGIKQSNISMSGAFRGCTSLTNVTLINTDIPVDLGGAFSGCTRLKSIDLSPIKKAHDLKEMCLNCSGLTSVNLGNLDAQEVESLRMTFDGCTNLSKITGSISAPNVTDIAYMFYGCNSIDTSSVNNFISGITSQKITSMYDALYKCNNVEYLDLYNLDMSSMKSTETIEYNCANLNKVIIPKIIGDVPLGLEKGFYEGETNFNNIERTKTATNINQTNSQSKITYYRKYKVNYYDENGELITTEYIKPNNCITYTHEKYKQWFKGSISSGVISYGGIFNTNTYITEDTNLFGRDANQPAIISDVIYYDGEYHQFITAGSSGLEYRCDWSGSSSTDFWYTDVQYIHGKYTGTYNIYYRYKNTTTIINEDSPLVVTIKEPLITAPTLVASTIYILDSNTITLVNPGETADGARIEYQLWRTYYATKPLKTSLDTLEYSNSGTFTVKYRILYKNGSYGNLISLGNVSLRTDNVTKHPTGSIIEYDGNIHKLVTPGETQQGSHILYCVNDLYGEYTENIPEAVDPGSYKVYYKVYGSSAYSVDTFIIEEGSDILKQVEEGGITWTLHRDGTLEGTGDGHEYDSTYCLSYDFSAAYVKNIYCDCTLYPYCDSLFSSLNKAETFKTGPNFNSKYVESLYDTFYACTNMTSIDFSNFSSEKLTNLYETFSNCSSLKDIQFGNKFSGKIIDNIYDAFYDCDSLEELDISSWDITNIGTSDIEYMLDSCYELKKLKAPSNIGDTSINLPYYDEEVWYLDDKKPYNMADSDTSYGSIITNVSNNSHTYIRNDIEGFIPYGNRYKVVVPAQIELEYNGDNSYSKDVDIKVKIISDDPDYKVTLLVDDTFEIADEDKKALMNTNLEQNKFSHIDDGMQMGDDGYYSKDTKLNIEGNIFDQGNYYGTLVINMSSEN